MQALYLEKQEISSVAVTSNQFVIALWKKLLGRSVPSIAYPPAPLEPNKLSLGRSSGLTARVKPDEPAPYKKAA